jgi:hypothetical protein
VRQRNRADTCRQHRNKPRYLWSTRTERARRARWRVGWLTVGTHAAFEERSERSFVEMSDRFIAVTGVTQESLLGERDVNRAFGDSGGANEKRG